MSLSDSTTYVYAYIAFAVVYVISSATLIARALRIGAALTRQPEADRAPGSVSRHDVDVSMRASRRLTDYAQLATLLPLVYIAGSMLLGSLILRGQPASLMNTVWIVFTVAAAALAVALTIAGSRQAVRLSDTSLQIADDRIAEAMHRTGIRLAVSAALLLLVAVFTALNLFSVLSDLGTLKQLEFVL